MKACANISTIKELYEWAVANEVEKADVYVKDSFGSQTILTYAEINDYGTSVELY